MSVSMDIKLQTLIKFKGGLDGHTEDPFTVHPSHLVLFTDFVVYRCECLLIHNHII